MYSDVFLLATAISGVLALAALRLGLPAALAATAAMLLFLVPGRGTLAVLPYVGEVAVSMDFYKLPFVVTSVILGLLVAFYSPPYLRHLGAPRWYYGVHVLYVLSFVYIIVFENLIFVFLALELSIITSFLLIWYFGYGNRRFVALLYFVWAQVGSILFLVGVAISGTLTADVFRAAGVASLLVLLGLLIKMGTAGVHFWLPYAHAEAPTPLSALLSPVHVGLMAYWIWRLKAGAGWPLDALFLYGLVTAIYGSLLVFRETDFKRALADSTVANMGLLVAAAAIGNKSISYAATALFVCGARLRQGRPLHAGRPLHSGAPHQGHRRGEVGPAPPRRERAGLRGAGGALRHQPHRQGVCGGWRASASLHGGAGGRRLGLHRRLQLLPLQPDV
jgi:formate hydrogenlyase subunit 3/multisubunit Na+/H+ antiporter MnhD subunit